MCYHKTRGHAELHCVRHHHVEHNHSHAGCTCENEHTTEAGNCTTAHKPACRSPGDGEKDPDGGEEGDPPSLARSEHCCDSDDENGLPDLHASCCCACAHDRDHVHHDTVQPSLHLDLECDCGNDHSGHDHAEEGLRSLLPLIAGAAFFSSAVLLGRTHMNAFADAVMIAAYVILGWRPIRLAVTNAARGQLMDENFLMTLATAGALVLRDFPEAAAVMLFYRVGSAFQDRAVSNSLRSINALMELMPETAILLDDGVQREVLASSLKPRDIIVIRPGDKVPADCVILSGESSLDKSALSGEVLPEAVGPSTLVLSGAVNLEAVLAAEVFAPANASAAAKVIAMVDQASKQKAPTEQFITRFSRLYTPIVCTLALLTAVVSVWLLGRTWNEGLRAACVFLVVSCPCALVLSVPLGFFAGLGLSSKHGVLVKGGNYLEALGEVTHLAFDKTGTLTTGQLSVTHIEPIGVSMEELLHYATAAEQSSAHPIARAFIEYSKSIAGNTPQVAAEQVHELPGRGISCVVDGYQVLCGNARLLSENGVLLPEGDSPATLYVAVNGSCIGQVFMADQLREDTTQTVVGLRELGISYITVLSGDREEAVSAAASEAGIANFSAELLPWQKVETLQALVNNAQRGERVACVGDGINDAPMLAVADVGISMGLGSDAAIEASDIVLIEEKLGGLVKAVKASRATRSVVRQNIVLSLGVKVSVMGLALIGYSSMWAAVVADVGVALAAILNAARLLRMKL